jgi:hypothetical protein
VTDLDVEVVHPVTGEKLDHLDTRPPETVAEVVDALRKHIAVAKAMLLLAERELRHRVDVKTGGFNRVAIFGEWEVQDHPARRREWDPDDLEAVLRELVDDGVVTAGEVTEVIRHKTEVNGAEAASLERRLAGPPLEAIKACREWVSKPGKLDVVRSVQLPSPEEVHR